jgi:hypothetical protein
VAPNEVRQREFSPALSLPSTLRTRGEGRCAVARHCERRGLGDILAECQAAGADVVTEVFVAICDFATAANTCASHIHREKTVGPRDFCGANG